MPPRICSLHPAAFVTGAGAGLGRAFAEALLAEGVRVWGTSRDPARLKDLEERHPGRFRAVALDLGDRAGAAAAFDGAVREAGGPFPLVVNNAGYGVFGGFAAADFAVWDRQFAEMLGTAALLSHRAVRGMRERGSGCLVHVSSLAVEFPLPFMSGYNVVKAGLSALSESLQFETRGSPVVVIDFRPGDYRTGFNDAMRRVAAGEGAQEGPAGGRAGEALRRERVWGVLEANLKAAPPPARAAADLRRAILRGRGGVVRSGGFFQARLAPLAARLLPAAWMRGAAALYFGCG